MSANAITEPVWANVVTRPRTTACRIVPRSPTRYAATIVFPCPGVKAWAAPNTKQSSNTTPKPRSFSNSAFTPRSRMSCHKVRGEPTISTTTGEASGCTDAGLGFSANTTVATRLRARLSSPGLYSSGDLPRRSTGSSTSSSSTESFAFSIVSVICPERSSKFWSSNVNDGFSPEPVGQSALNW